MFRGTPLRPAAIVVLLSVSLAPAWGVAYSREEVAGRPGVYLSWTSRRLSYSINERASADLSLAEATGAIRRAFFSWASPSCTDISFDFQGYDPAVRTNLTLGAGQSPDHKNLIVWHEDVWPPAGVTDPSVTSDIPAVTTLIYDPASGHILEADIDLNGYNFVWSTTDEPGPSATDLQSVLTHEIGHLLGLAHSADGEATMYASLGSGELKKRSLEQDDLAGVCFLYPFAGSTPAGPGTGTVPTPESGGCQLVEAPLATSALVGGGLLLALLGLAALRWRRRRPGGCSPR